MSSIAAACGAHGCAVNIHKRYLIHVAGFNLGALMCALIGQGTPRGAAEVAYADTALAFGLIAVIDGQPAALVVTIGPNPTAS